MSILEDVKHIFCKWVYRIKHPSDGLDYDEKFSLVVKTIIVQVLLALAISIDWKLWQTDMKNALLHEKDREICMNQPKGFENRFRVVSWYMQTLKKPRLDAAWQILQYVKDTIDYGQAS